MDHIQSELHFLPCSSFAGAFFLFWPFVNGKSFILRPGQDLIHEVWIKYKCKQIEYKHDVPKSVVCL